MGRQVSKNGESEVEAKDEQEQAAPAEVAPPALVGGAMGVPGAVPAEAVMDSKPAAEVVRAKQMMVMRDARINALGGITYLRAGQIVDDNNYDFAQLTRTGVVLGPVE